MKQEVKYWYLRSYNLFSNLNHSQLNDICEIATFRMARRGDTVFNPHQTSKNVYFLIEGKIKISENEASGDELLKDVIREGDLFGEFTLGEPEKDSTEFAKVISREAIYCSFTMAQFEEILVNYPTLAIRFSKEVGLRLRRLEHRYANLVLKDVRHRLLDFLKSWAITEGQNVAGKICVNNYLTQSDIADLISTSRQSVTSILNELEHDGTIAYNRRQIVFNDMAKLG